MAYQRSPSRVPSDRRSDYAVADDFRTEARRQQDLTIDNTAGKWRYKAAPLQGRTHAGK